MKVTNHSIDRTVAIVGAGPYGLSIAANLRSRGAEFRIFGLPMHCWRSHMPAGMFLKSEGCASNLFAAADIYTFEKYCELAGLPYAPQGMPVSLSNFTEYALSFQRRFVPTVEETILTSLSHYLDAFELRFANGERFCTKKVVLATGTARAQYVPRELTELPGELLSHSGSHHDLRQFNGRDVIVVGGGQSALEIAALLCDVGAQVRLLVRKALVKWNRPPELGFRSISERLRRPMSKLGPGLGAWLYSNAPTLFRYLPADVRVARVQSALGPAGAWWLKERVVGRVPIKLGHVVRKAEARGGKALLTVQVPNGEVQQFVSDHVISATGYRYDLRSLPFISESLLSRLKSVKHSPVLSSNFESSVPGLYFVGLASAYQFGPVMRFLHGAGCTARRVSRHIAEACCRFSVTAMHHPALRARDGDGNL